ncbi:hotdog fold thioesterase [Propionibacteriaceae bacterium G1746]
MLAPDQPVDPSVFDLPHEQRMPEWAWAMSSALDDRMGLQIAELTAQRCVGRYPVEGNTQPFGLWHGGASGVVIETLASFAANAYGREFGKGAVGVDLTATHHRSVRHGHVTGYATPLHLGRTLVTYQVHLYDDRQRLIGSGGLTCHLINLKED